MLIKTNKTLERTDHLHFRKMIVEKG